LGVLQETPVNSYSRVQSQREQGTFELSLPKGKFKLLAETVDGSGELEVNVDGVSQEVQISFVDKNLTVEVFSSTGEPVVGADVVVRKPGQRPLDYGTTGASGKVQFALSGDTNGLMVQANSRWRTAEDYLSTRQEKLTLQLAPASSIVGIVRVPGSGAVPSYSVSLPEWGDGQTPVPSLQFAGSAFRLPEAPSASYTMHVLGDDGSIGQASVAVKPGEPAAV